MDIQYYIFGAICITIVMIVAFILAFMEHTKDTNVIEETSNEDIELSQALENIKIYNAVNDTDRHRKVRPEEHDFSDAEII